MNAPVSDLFASARRVDLHCHSDASNKAAEVVLNAIACPECYSRPDEVYQQAKRRGMDFVTLTDHDSIAGVQTLEHRKDVLCGEELTCWFPEDRCKMHILVWGITPEDHDALQARSRDIYDVAAYMERRRIAHAVAHPIYRQNEKLERWHVERLLLLFKGFECLNGAHSPLHREAFEPLLDRLTKEEIQKLSQRHGLSARWDEPWIKSRTGGSDDHGLLNVGRTWTEFPAGTDDVERVLRCLREGRCRPGGEAGSSAKLAHTFYSVAVRYYGRHLLGDGPANVPTMILQTLVGERPAPSRRSMAGWVMKRSARKLKDRMLAPFRRKQDEEQGVGVLRKLFLDSARQRMGDYPALRKALENGLPPLGEHDEVMRFVGAINRDLSQGIAQAVDGAIEGARFTGLFDAISAALAQQFALLPYYFAVFHQNKERHLLRQLTGQHRSSTADSMKVGLFTDTLDEVNGVSRFIRDMTEQALRAGRHLVVHTCSPEPRFESAARKNFQPLLSRPMPYYPELKLNLPPVLEVLEWADRQQFDAVHVSTPGPMGLCGWMVGKMLRVPVLGTYHTDFPAYVDHLTGDHRITRGTSAYMRWFYSQMAAVFTRSREYRFSLGDLGVEPQKVREIPAGVNMEKFNPRHRDPTIWQRLGVQQPKRLLYVGRVSVEKNLPLLVETYRQLRAIRQDIALIIAGDGPYLPAMKKELKGSGSIFLGYQNDAELAALYSSADLFIFPSRTDTLGQVVMEAQSSGLPAIVSDTGGPRELVEDGTTGLVVDGQDVGRWRAAIEQLLDDDVLRGRMSRAATARMSRRGLDQTFNSFWTDHLNVVEPSQCESDNEIQDLEMVATSSTPRQCE
ncbi:MAG: glycosyltransferase [Phycisphaerales bacterium]|jgi:glycosyltransferase involved in cell wall biosynthesis|nr:glycosyltransferase [Phycisphaerales bacterium]